MACLGCSGDVIQVNLKAGEKRRRKMEELQKKAETARKTQKRSDAAR
jgi:hypothetical protein